MEEIFDLNIDYDDHKIYEFCAQLAKTENYKGIFNRKAYPNRLMIFQHTDLDGAGSGNAILYCMNNGDLMRIPYSSTFRINYKSPLSEVVGDIKDDWEYWFVDYSISSPENIDFAKKNFVNRTNVVWVDHHKTSVDAIEENPELNNINGLVIKEKLSGAILTWAYINLFCKLKLSIPKMIKYVSDYDTFSHNLDNVIQFYYGIGVRDYQNSYKVWEKLLSNNNEVDRVIQDGSLIETYQNNVNDLVLKNAFETNIDGYKVICLNRSGNSLMFRDYYKTYDIVCPFYYDGNIWNYSLFSHRDDIDVSQIAIKYGGGGHKSAAGFTTKELIFK